MINDKRILIMIKENILQLSLINKFITLCFLISIRVQEQITIGLTLFHTIIHKKITEVPKAILNKMPITMGHPIIFPNQY